MDLPVLIIFIAVIISQWILMVVFYKKNSSLPARTLTEPQSLNILHRAYKKAQAILGQAELTSIKIHAQSELEAKKVSDKLGEALSQEGREELRRYLKEFEQVTARATQKSLEEYKLARMKALDDGISAVVQKTVETVLSRTLTAKEQSTLVYEALEQAKKEKLIV